MFGKFLKQDDVARDVVAIFGIADIDLGFELSHAGSFAARS
jgi:hypothetical protein